jgi:hypothetical protein
MILDCLSGLCLIPLVLKIENIIQLRSVRFEVRMTQFAISDFEKVGEESRAKHSAN